VLRDRDETIESLKHEVRETEKRMRGALRDAAGETAQMEEGYLHVVQGLKQDHDLMANKLKQEHAYEIASLRKAHHSEMESMRAQVANAERAAEMPSPGMEAHVSSLDRQINRWKDAFETTQSATNRLQEELDKERIEKARREKERVTTVDPNSNPNPDPYPNPNPNPLTLIPFEGNSDTNRERKAT